MRVNKRKGITELQAQMLFQQLMKALAFLHDQNIIHGDLKPQNVLLSKKPFAVVKICDFGNARFVFKQLPFEFGPCAVALVCF